jgi:hypothetical protein
VIDVGRFPSVTSPSFGSLAFAPRFEAGGRFLSVTSLPSAPLRSLALVLGDRGGPVPLRELPFFPALTVANSADP